MTVQIGANSKKENCQIKGIIVSDTRYKEWLKDLSTRYRGSQIKAARSVNREMITFYWSLGRDIIQMDAENVYGSGFYEKLSSDLKGLIPDSRGLSPRNLRYMKRLFLLDISIYDIFPQIVENFPQSGEDLVNTLPRDGKELKTNLPQFVAEFKNSSDKESSQNLPQFGADLVNTHIQPLDELAYLLEKSIHHPEPHREDCLRKGYVLPCSITPNQEERKCSTT